MLDCFRIDFFDNVAERCDRTGFDSTDFFDDGTAWSDFAGFFDDGAGFDDGGGWCARGRDECVGETESRDSIKLRVLGFGDRSECTCETESMGPITLRDSEEWGKIVGARDDRAFRFAAFSTSVFL